jgi:hypothetical protein
MGAQNVQETDESVLSRRTRMTGPPRCKSYSGGFMRLHNTAIHGHLVRIPSLCFEHPPLVDRGPCLRPVDAETCTWGDLVRRVTYHATVSQFCQASTMDTN